MLCIGLLLCCGPTYRVLGQLTARNADGSAVTFYTNDRQTRDTIFVFNQTPQPKKGNLSLVYRPPSTITWTRKNPETSAFDFYKAATGAAVGTETLEAGDYRITIANPYAPTKTISCTVSAARNEDETYTVTVASDNLPNPVTEIKSEPKGRLTVTADPVECIFKWYFSAYGAKDFASSAFKTEQGFSTSADNLDQGGYKVTVQPVAASSPTDSFVAWLYMNPGFDFKLFKDNSGDVIFAYKHCGYTDFRLDPAVPTKQSVFAYFDPNNPSREGTLTNKLSFTIKRGSAAESTTFLNEQNNVQYFRDYSPPYEDTRFTFKGDDMFGVERKDDIYYETIIPKAAMTAILPEVDPKSAPVPVKFTDQSVNATEYLWRFGDGDSAAYNLEKLPPDTVKHTYYTPKKTAYIVVLFVKSGLGCTDSVRTQITVDPSDLAAANVFTPNGDNVNDYFKPYNVSLRDFEISIYTRAGKRIYHYKGGDLRNWQGWDGRIQNTGKDAAEGVYFYVITATGWDGIQYNKKEGPGTYGGSLHLYR